MNGSHGSFIDGLSAAARENPLAAALIGGGALWLLIGSDKLKNAAIQNRGGKLVSVAPKGSTNAKVQWPMLAYDKRR